MSSHETDCILSEMQLLAVSWLFLYRRISSLMNALEGECLCLCEMSINVYRFFMLLLFEYFVYVCLGSVIVACLLVYSLVYTEVVDACLLSYPFFILRLLVYFCLFVDHVNKSRIFNFRTFLSFVITAFPYS